MIVVTIDGTQLRRGLRRALRRYTMAKIPSSVLVPIFDEVGKRGKRHWKEIAYEFYDKRVSEGLPVSGQLGNGLYYQIRPSPPYSLTFRLKKLYKIYGKGIEIKVPAPRLPSPTVRAPSLRIPQARLPRFPRVYEYSQYLRRRVMPSPGRYVRALDARIRRGTHRGADNTTRWQSLTQALTTFARLAILQKILNMRRRRLSSVR